MYNFDKLAKRKNTDSFKWDLVKNTLPMWVADMDFETLPDIVETLKNRIDIRAYGYSLISDDWYSSIINWWKDYKLDIKKENMIFTNGVVAAISALVNRLSNIGDDVVVITPIYNIFFNSILNHGRHVLECKLDYDSYKYSLDFSKLEDLLKRPLTTLMILCNPQNPVGNIWTKEELIKISNLCKKYNVKVISDEIHCDITRPNMNYVPFASVSHDAKYNSITLVSPSKTFNMAGLNSACAIVYDEYLYNVVERALNSYEVAEPNFFAIDATIAAYTKGREWVNELRSYVFNNRDIAKEYISKNIKNIHLIDADATYLLWVDCSNITSNSKELQEFLIDKVSLFVSSGDVYHGNGDTFLRINVATSKANVLDGLNRLKEGIELYTKQIKK